MDNKPAKPAKAEPKTEKDYIEDLKKQLNEALLKLADYEWAYNLTEGILRADRKWYGVNERWSLRKNLDFPSGEPILAAKLAKELMVKRVPVPPKTAELHPPPVVNVPDYHKELIDWIKAGSYRIVQYCPDKMWKIEDAAMSRKITFNSFDDFIRSEAWTKFKSWK